MPSKPRVKERERDPDTPRSKDKARHRSSRPSRKVDKSCTPPERRSTNTSPATTKRRASMPLPDLAKDDTSDSPLGSKTSLPYPSFSKAHSKEAVGSRENVVNPRLSYYTPDPTDLDKDKENAPTNGGPSPAAVAPPSPPETAMDQRSQIEKPRVGTVKVKVERRRSDLQKTADQLKKKFGRASSDASDRKDKDRHSNPARSRNSTRETSKEEEDRSNVSAKRSKPGTPSKLRLKQPTVEDSTSTAGGRLRPPSSVHSTARTEDTDGSTADSGATERPASPRPDRDSSPATDPDSSPRTPTLTEPKFPPSRKETPAFSALGSHIMSGATGESPMPPPPPPPPQVLAPRVDYLVQNGGLPRSVPRTLVGALPPPQSSQAGPQSPAQLENVFLPFHDLFDRYEKVMACSGSLAVATGYRSVARRLLDRLEAVFARDISSETCTCILCQASADYNIDDNDRRGVSWGEILEYVCGRQELPQWPAFVMDSTQVGLGISTSDNAAPMQKLDVDVPEEYRDHYVRQSKKTKQSVDRWLESQPHQPSSPPQDVDDDTLIFAMLTRLEPEQRPIFSSLIGVIPSRPASRTGTPSINPAADLLKDTGLAIQRLYRLPSPPRDPESAMYLLTNPPLHNVLATLAAVSDGEWDLLTSGRFDGFLRSGADDPPTSTAPPSRGPSRGPPPRVGSQSVPPSRGSTPATAGAPVTLDEETEIATLAEVEREIFLSMERLENAFEALHNKAETVRRVMRERGAGLAQANQERRGGTPSELRMGTPASFAWESETDDGFDDGASELMPDDSASNISSSRHRRPKRRHERRTPAPVEEEDEEGAFSEVGTKGGRKR